MVLGILVIVFEVFDAVKKSFGTFECLSRAGIATEVLRLTSNGHAGIIILHIIIIYFLLGQVCQRGDGASM